MGPRAGASASSMPSTRTSCCMRSLGATLPDIRIMTGQQAERRTNNVNIDRKVERRKRRRQLAARRSAYGEARSGLLGRGDWRKSRWSHARDRAPPDTASTKNAASSSPSPPRGDLQGDHHARAGRPRHRVRRPRGTQPAVRIALKLADQTPSDNDLMQHEVRVLGLLLAEPHKPASHLAPLRDQFLAPRRPARHRVRSPRRLRSYGRARPLPASRRAGLPARHRVGVAPRARRARPGRTDGILHGNLDPSHILVRPHDHKVWVVDWTSAVVNPARTGAGLQGAQRGLQPARGAPRGSPTPRLGSVRARQVRDPRRRRRPRRKELPEMDPRLRRFLRYMTVESQGGRPQDAWELYQQIDRLRTADLERAQVRAARAYSPLRACKRKKAQAKHAMGGGRTAWTSPRRPARTRAPRSAHPRRSARECTRPEPVRQAPRGQQRDADPGRARRDALARRRHQARLRELPPQLMGRIELKGYIENPGISFCGIGDAFSDRAPLQVGQFEGDNKLDEVLERIWIEEGGAAPARRAPSWRGLLQPHQLRPARAGHRQEGAASSSATRASTRSSIAARAPSSARSCRRTWTRARHSARSPRSSTCS